MTNSAQITDNDLIRKVIEGDTHAFKLLVQRHKDVSLSLAFSILKDRSVAQDVLQEVFIKVFHKLETFRFKSAFSTWLYRIVVNTSYNELKRHRGTTSMHEYATESLSPIVEERDLLKEKDQKHFINLALLRLRADEALVLRLFYLCELSIKEIAEITKFKPPKIKVDLHRGRENLNFQLRQLLGEDIKHLL
ncbi:MAG: sigma-70 family RNA polymerase sigma factor [Bacteroidota bacterium]